MEVFPTDIDEHDKEEVQDRNLYCFVVSSHTTSIDICPGHGPLYAGRNEAKSGVRLGRASVVVWVGLRGVRHKSQRTGAVLTPSADERTEESKIN